MKPLAIVADLTKPEDVENLFNRTIEQFGKLDVLVNDAGSFLYNPITNTNFMEVFERNMNIDLKPALELIRLAIPYLKRTKGTIINISSVLTQRPVYPFCSFLVFFFAHDCLCLASGNVILCGGQRSTSTNCSGISTRVGSFWYQNQYYQVIKIL